MAALMVKGEESPVDRQFCGGTLVAPNAVVSAAHCAFDVVPPADGGFDPIFFDVVPGRTVLSSTEGQEIPVANYFVFTDAAGTTAATNAVMATRIVLTMRTCVSSVRDRISSRSSAQALPFLMVDRPDAGAILCEVLNPDRLSRTST